MKNYKNGFTFVELIIVIALLAVLSVILLMVINPFKQMEKSWDMQKKHDLAIMQKMFEDYYNDKEAYPQPEDVCLDEVQEIGGICSCHICGLVRNNFSAYLQKLHCDPQHPNFDYLYQFECEGNNQNFRICAVLNSKKNQLPNRYHYGIASPNFSKDECGNIPLTGQSRLTPTPTPTAGRSRPTPTSIPTLTPTPTIIPTPTLDPTFTQYYCAESGCKPCDVRGNDCYNRLDKCHGILKQFSIESDCVTSHADPVNGCECL